MAASQIASEAKRFPVLFYRLTSETHIVSTNCKQLQFLFCSSWAFTVRCYRIASLQFLLLQKLRLTFILFSTEIMNSCLNSVRTEDNRKKARRKKSKALADNRHKAFRCFKTFMFRGWAVKTNGGWKIQGNINKGLFGRRSWAWDPHFGRRISADVICAGARVNANCPIKPSPVSPGRPSLLMKRSISDEEAHVRHLNSGLRGL